MRNDNERLEDIAEAIERILERTVAGREAFEQDLMLQVRVVHHLQIIGEAARISAKAGRSASKCDLAPPMSTVSLGMGNQFSDHDDVANDLEVEAPVPIDPRLPNVPGLVVFLSP